MPLNSYVSLNASAYEENDDTSVMEVLETQTIDDPSDIIANKEYFDYMENKIDNSLSDFEKQVLKYYKRGDSYANIAAKLDSKVKCLLTKCGYKVYNDEISTLGIRKFECNREVKKYFNYINY